MLPVPGAHRVNAAEVPTGAVDRGSRRADSRVSAVGVKADPAEEMVLAVSCPLDVAMGHSRRSRRSEHRPLHRSLHEPRGERAQAA